MVPLIGIHGSFILLREETLFRNKVFYSYLQ